MNATPADVHAGQAIYTKRLLAVYDLAVLGISSRLVWKCPARVVEAHYNTHVTANHLDVGVGTGHFLARCRFPVTNRAIPPVKTSGPLRESDIPPPALARIKSGLAAASARANASPRRGQAALASRSRRGRQVMASRSGHHVQIDDRALVVRTIREILETPRR